MAGWWQKSRGGCSKKIPGSAWRSLRERFLRAAPRDQVEARSDWIRPSRSFFLDRCGSCDNPRVRLRPSAASWIARAWIVAALLSSTPAAAQSDPDPWFGRDKLLHFGASAEIATNGYTLGAAFWEDRRARLASGAVLALTAGIAKELYDLSGHGDPSWKDLTWDVIGTATGLLISWLVDKYLFGRERAGGVHARAFGRDRPTTASEMFLREPLGLILHRCPAAFGGAACKP